MKGANFIPPDIFLPRVNKSDYERIIQSAVDAHMNMLRVWGGGTYADEDFYDLCDEKGILVWQDFMFACAMYPGDTAFVNNVKQEITEQVKRLQNHPCIALWCGNNENDEGWKNWGWQKQLNYSKQDSAKIWSDYKNLFEKIIPQIVSGNDPQRPYWPSSPSVGWGRKESLLQGDVHYWGVWWGLEPFEAYAQKVGRFMSEYGFQGLPSAHCIKTFYPYSTKPTPAFLNSRQKHPKGQETIDTYLKRDFIEPRNYEDLTYVSQLVQARGLEIAIQAHRRNKPYCMGSLYWQLNDCWPGITWSSIDFTGNWKAAHYAAKWCFSPLLISLETKGDSVSVHLVSDLLEDMSGELGLELFDFSGKLLWKKSLNVNAVAGSAQKVFSCMPALPAGLKKEQVVLRATLKSKDKLSAPASAMHYFASPKDLELKKPTINVVEVAGGYELSTSTLAKNVFLDAGPGVNFSDNYFDLLPGEKKRVKIAGKNEKKQKIIVRSLADTY
jgi:beta-mannosidase